MDKDELKKMLKEIQAEQKDGDDSDTGDGDNGGSQVTADIQKAADRIADRIIEAVAQKKGVTADSDKKELKQYLFDPQTGFKAANYPEDIHAATDDQKIVAFFKSWVRRDYDEESSRVFKALVEGTDAEGGYLVPAPLAAEVWRVLPDISVMRRIARTIPMSSQTLQLNNLAARPHAYWTSEYAQKTTSSADFGQTTLTANKLVALLPVTHELLADANINLANFVIELFAEAIGLEEDNKFFTGSGTGQPRGINQESLTSIDAGGSVSMDDVIGLIDSVPSRVAQSPRAAFVGHKYAKRILRNLKDSNNNYIWRDSSVGRMSGQTERLPDMLYGYAFYEQNDLAQSELYFGDWSYYLIGDRQQMTVSSTNEGGDAWRRDATEFKAVERVDGRAVITTPFAKITNLK